MNHKKLIVVLLTLACGPMLFACMYIANDWLLAGEVEFLKTPRLIFGAELARMSEGSAVDFKSAPATNGYPTQTLETELSDLAMSLKNTGVPSTERQELLSGYHDARNQLAIIRKRVSDWRGTGNFGPVTFEPLPVISEHIPGEFAAYFNGCVQFYLGKTNHARHFWQSVLNLPESNRRYRSTWAAFMLGKMDVDTSPSTAIEAFQEVRELARAGYADGLGLASASYGWEARAWLNLEDPAAAIELYLKQQDTGILDMQSLRIAALAALQLSPDKLVNVANHKTARTVVSSYLLSISLNEDNWSHEEQRNYWIKWLNAATAAETPDYEAAEQFAWVAYQCGQFETAEQWLPFTDANSPGALWLASRLMLRNGDIDGAAKKLALATKFGPISDQLAGSTVGGVFSRIPGSAYYGSRGTLYRDSGTWFTKSGQDRIHGEHGVVQFQRREYLDALNILLIAGYWRDAAYVADRILTLDELQAYVDRHWPALPKREAAQENSLLENRNEKTTERIRYLLGRRLSRNKREIEAHKYYPEKWAAKFDELVAAIRGARNPSASDSEKAAFLYKAARITRWSGLELYGTATEPDWQVYSGNFTYFGPSLKLRHDLSADDAFYPTAEEEKRHSQSSPSPDQQFHYRRVAADLAWQAAELMPDQSDETAAVLCAGGHWAKGSNRPFADKFYKALVIRCGYTELGTAADRKRWFPNMTAEGRLNEPMPPPVKTTHSGPWEGDASL